MAFSYTLATLKSAIREWLEEDGAEFIASLDNIVNIAELRVIKDLDFTIFDVVSEGILERDVLEKPEGYIRTVNFIVGAKNSKAVLQPRHWDYVELYSGDGVPVVYAENSQSHLFFAPSPAAEITVDSTEITADSTTITADNGSFEVPYRWRYVKRPETLTATSGSQVTWISENTPDVLFWACIVESEHYRKADERIAVAEQMYEKALASAKAESKNLIRIEYR